MSTTLLLLPVAHLTARWLVFSTSCTLYWQVESIKAMTSADKLISMSVIVRNGHRARLRSAIASVVICLDSNCVATPIQVSAQT